MSEQHVSGDELDDFKEQDRFLPIANVARIMKKTLPDNAKIAKEAKETVQECVSEFISFITSEGRHATFTSFCACLWHARVTMAVEQGAQNETFSLLGFGACLFVRERVGG